MFHFHHGMTRPQVGSIGVPIRGSLVYTNYLENLEYHLPNSVAEYWRRGAEKFIEVHNRLIPIEDEPTFVRREYGVPSLLIRSDGVLGSEEPFSFEYEDRPGGRGMLRCISERFAENISKVEKTWPEYDVVVSPDHVWYDDGLNPRRRIILLEEAKNSNNLVLVRAEPWHKEYEVLTRRSISTIKYEGDKAYGADKEMNLWRLVKDPNILPWGIPFVVKAPQSSKARGIFVYMPNAMRINGYCSQKAIRREFDKHPDGMYVQEFRKPMESGLESYDLPKYMMLRVYFGYDTVQRRLVTLGGLCIVGNEVKLHATANTFVVPLIVV